MTSRDETRTEVLLAKPRRQLKSLDSFLEATLPALSARLWATCCWPDRMSDGWTIGDYNFLIVSMSPDRDTNLYVQFWSEPREEVLVEICSGNWNPGAVRYLREPQRQAIGSLGYAPGGTAGNFRRRVLIRNASEAEAVAAEALGVFWDVFGYRGACPLDIEFHKGERAEWEAVHASVTPEDVLKLAGEAGYRGGLISKPDEGPFLYLKRGRRRSIVQFDGQVAGENLFSGVLLRTLMRVPRELTAAEIGKVSHRLIGARLTIDEDGDGLLGMDLVLDGGVTAPWLMNRLQLWDSNCRRCERLIAKVSPKAVVSSTGRSSGRVH